MHDLRNWMIYVGKHLALKRHGEIREILEMYEKSVAISIFEKMFLLKTSEVCRWSKEYEEALKSRKIELCTSYDSDYPTQLKNIYDYPLCLYLRGNRRCLQNVNKVSIIGTRKPTYDGMKMCDLFVRDLSQIPFTIISGLAFGIDLCIHKAALKYGCPAIAVLASGISEITPKSNERVGLELLERGGLLISEYPPDTKVFKTNFVIRNRIISGLSMDLFVVEAGLRSGSLTTAKHALSQSRNIYAMPGSISNPVALGTNDLIKQGACVITRTEDFEPYSILSKKLKKYVNQTISSRSELLTKPNSESGLEERLLRKISTSGRITVGEVSSFSGVGDGELMSFLMELEMMNCIEMEGDIIFCKLMK